MTTAAFCEIDPFCRAVLAKHWPDVPCHDDVRQLDGREYEPDVVCGGYPCQPFSQAGKRRGAEDDRHLWPAMFAIIQRTRPTWVIGENVAGHISMGLDDVLSDLEGEGYACRPFVVPACAAGAPHRRDRVWVVANACSGRRSEQSAREVQQQRRTKAICASKNVANATGPRLQGARDVQGSNTSGKKAGQLAISSQTLCHTAGAGLPDWAGGEVEQPQPLTEFERPDGREIERDFRGIPHGISRRVDRLRALGNAVVPQIPEMIGRAIMQGDVI